jgi:hypothetical protein
LKERGISEIPESILTLLSTIKEPSESGDQPAAPSGDSDDDVASETDTGTTSSLPPSSNSGPANNSGGNTGPEDITEGDGQAHSAKSPPGTPSNADETSKPTKREPLSESPIEGGADDEDRSGEHSGTSRPLDVSKSMSSLQAPSTGPGSVTGSTERDRTADANPNDSGGGVSKNDDNNVEGDFRGELGSKKKQKSKHPSKVQKARRDQMVSYVRNEMHNADDTDESDSLTKDEKKRIGQLAVNWIVTQESEAGRKWIPQEFENEGFDLLLENEDGTKEYAEVKGTRGQWTERGIAVSPAQVRFSATHAGVWLFVVEYVEDQDRRTLYKIKDPFRLATQFRFDSGWKNVSEQPKSPPLRPQVGQSIEIPGRGIGEITDVRGLGLFRKLTVQFGENEKIGIRFDPGKMVLISK